MTPEEMTRYHGSRMDTARTDENLDEYLAMMRERLIIQDPAYAEKAQIVRNHGDLDYQGVPPVWSHVGPFPCGGGEFTTKYPPEMSIEPDSGGVDLDATYDSPDGTVRWQRATADSTGYIDLKALVSDKNFQVAYSIAWIDNPTPRRVYIRVGSNDYMSVFVNDELIYNYLTPRTAIRDDHVFVADLPAGRVPIMVKVANLKRTWGFYLCVTDRDGRAIPGVTWASSPTR